MSARILIIDDEETIRDFVAASLEDRGYETKAIGSGKKALEEIKSGYNLVIEDIVLPDINGLDLLARIKEISPQTEVILVTGHATLDSAITSVEYGAFAYITKPFHEDQLWHTAERALEKQKLVLENQRLLADLKDSNVRLENLNRELEERVDERTRKLRSSEEEIRKKARELATINEITNAITSSLDLNRVFQIVTRETLKIVPFDRASISLINGSNRINRVYFLAPAAGEPLESGQTYPLSGTGIEWVIKKKKTLIRPNFHRKDSYLEDEFIRGTGAKSGIVVPLIYRGEAIGTLNLGSMRKNTYTKEHERILRQIAGQIAIAIKNAEFYKAVIEHGNILESRVEERTRELRENLRHLEEAQDKLIQSEKLAAISKLIAGVAHEIKNPLNSMSFSTANIENVLRSDFSPERIREFCTESLDILKSDIARLKGLVDSFMSFAKPSPVDFENIDVNEIIRTVVRRLRPELDQKGVEIVESYDQGLPPFRLEKDEFYRSILNLLLNSLDAVGRGGRIEITTRSADDEASIEIRDNGRGIPLEIQDKIYDVFFTTKSKGAGLGLSQVYRTIQSLKGSINCRSRPGQGTLFTIYLPFRRTRG